MSWHMRNITFFFIFLNEQLFELNPALKRYFSSPHILCLLCGQSFYMVLASFERAFDISNCANSGVIFYSNNISISLRHYVCIDQSSSI